MIPLFSIKHLVVRRSGDAGEQLLEVCAHKGHIMSYFLFLYFERPHFICCFNELIYKKKTPYILQIFAINPNSAALAYYTMVIG